MLTRRSLLASLAALLPFRLPLPVPKKTDWFGVGSRVCHGNERSLTYARGRLVHAVSKGGVGLVQCRTMGCVTWRDGDRKARVLWTSYDTRHVGVARAEYEYPAGAECYLHLDDTGQWRFGVVNLGTV